MKDKYMKTKHIIPINRGVISEHGVMFARARTRPEGINWVMDEDKARDKNPGSGPLQ